MIFIFTFIFIMVLICWCHWAQISHDQVQDNTVTTSVKVLDRTCNNFSFFSFKKLEDCHVCMRMDLRGSTAEGART